ncbi:MAG TPA: hypothetical protein VNR62_11880 [Cellulomonas sp.]|nr:hypothetical protein [Cellulomonas sp.]
MTDVDATHDDLVVTCPECGSVAHVRSGQRLASDFCPTCDYPLFWAKPTTADAETQESVDARWRAPGASGTAALSTLACPACSELNLPTAVTCVRCGASMTPPPPPVEPPPPAPAPVVVVQAPPQQVPCNHPDTWWVVVLTATVSVALTLLVVWWL